MNKNTTMTLTNEWGNYSVSIEETGLTTHAMCEDVVGPLMKAAGYAWTPHNTPFVYDMDFTTTGEDGPQTGRQGYDDDEVPF